MELGCSANISGGDAVGEVGEIDCGIELPIEPYQVGDKIDAGNRIIVEVSEVIEPDNEDFSIACFNFYLPDDKLGLYKLNDEYVCLQNLVLDDTPLECAMYSLPTEYGVAIDFQFRKGKDLLLDVYPTTSGDIYTPLDLFGECIGTTTGDDKCTKFLKDMPMDGEASLQEGGLEVFFPSESPEIGDYLIKQLEACWVSINEILSPAETILDDASLRYYLGSSSGSSSLGEPDGRFIGPDYVLVYDSQRQIGDLLESIDPANINNETCRDSVILHELCHGGCWTAGGGNDPYFKLTLQEGACYSIGSDYITPPSLVLDIKADMTLHESEGFALESYGGTEVFEVKEITADDITLSLSYISEDGDIYPEGELVIGAQSVENIVGYTDIGSHLIVDQLIIDGDDKSARVRLVEFHGPERTVEHLTCGEDSFSVGYDYWIDDKPYKDNNSSGPHGPYSSLDQTVEYMTGACFFKGIGQMYQSEGKGFETFFPGLITSTKQYAFLPLKDQHEKKFCILDEMQSVLDEDIGAGKYSIKEYAKKFGYDEKILWCSKLYIHQGNTKHLLIQ